MRGYLRLFEQCLWGAAFALWFAVAGCSARPLVVVDPDPCADGGVAGCVPPGLLDDLVGYWRLDDLPGSATARDLSGWANHGSLVNLDPAMAWVDGGRAAGALSVQAAGFVDVPSSTSIDSITSEVTVAAWIFFEGSVIDWGTAISRQVGTTFAQHYHLSINVSEAAALFIRTDLGEALLQGPTPIPRARWIHLAGTYDGESVRLYVDGAEIARRPLTGVFEPDVNAVLLGGNGNSVGSRTELFPGRLDEVMLYRRALGPEEIEQLHAGALFPASVLDPDGGR
jgi:hypothetical protein